MRGARPTAAPWTALLAATGVQTAISCTEQGIPTLTAFLKHDLALSASVAGLIVSSLNAGKIAGSYAAGHAADRLGELSTLAVGALGTGVLVIVAALVPTPLMPVALVSAGVFAAAGTPAGGRLVVQLFPATRRGLALGIRQAGIPAGGIAAALVLPRIADGAGWRPAFVAAGAMTLAGVVWIALVARLGVSRPVQEPTSETSVALLRDANVRRIVVWGCILVGGQYTILTFLALDATTGTTRRLASAAVLLAVAQASGIAGRLFWGVTSDRAFAGRRKPAILLITLLAFVSAIVLALLPRPAPFAAFAAASAVAGLSLVGWQGLWVTAVAELAGSARTGVTTGFALTFIAVAITVSPPLYGAVVDLGGYRLMWGVLAATILAAFVNAARFSEERTG